MSHNVDFPHVLNALIGILQTTNRYVTSIGCEQINRSVRGQGLFHEGDNCCLITDIDPHTGSAYFAGYALGLSLVQIGHT